MELVLDATEAQIAFGARLALVLNDLGARGLTIYLEGDLGTGKTTLVRGLLRGLGHQGSVRSPTYTLIEPYDLASGSVYHLDLYRLADPEELEYLGLRDLSGDESLMLVEWPERAGTALPPADLWIRLFHQPQGRRLLLDAGSERGHLLIAALGRDGDLKPEIRP